MKKTVKKQMPFPVLGDNSHTVYYCTSKERGEAAVKKYEKEHKIYWI